MRYKSRSIRYCGFAKAYTGAAAIFRNELNAGGFERRSKTLNRCRFQCVTALETGHGLCGNGGLVRQIAHAQTKSGAGHFALRSIHMNHDTVVIFDCC